jgi:hypothetical protein
MRISRIVAAGTAAFLATAGMAVVVATPAQADLPIVAPVAPIDGYVWAWQPANPSYVAATGYEHNSAGGGIGVTRSGTGTYQVRFHGMAGAGGIAHVSAYGGSAICTVASWAPSGGDEVVNVRCFSSAGAPADSRFIAHVTNRTDGLSRGYLWNNDATPPAGGYVPSTLYSFDSTGATITVFPDGVGGYAVDLNAFGQDAPTAWAAGALRVTAYGTTAVTCQISDPAQFVDPDVLRVHCYDTTGHAVNSRFALSYARGVVPLSATLNNYGGAPVVVGWSGVAPTASALVDGDYTVSFPGSATAGGHAFGAIMATPPMYCNIHSWTASLGAQTLRVRCYQPGGGQLNPGMLINVGFFV